MEVLNSAVLTNGETLLLGTDTSVRITILNGGSSTTATSVVLTGNALRDNSGVGSTPGRAASLTIQPHYIYGVGNPMDVMATTVTVGGTASSKVLVQFR